MEGVECPWCLEKGRRVRLSETHVILSCNSTRTIRERGIGQICGKEKTRNSGSAQNRGGWSINKRATGKRSLNAANPTTVDKTDCGSVVTIN